MSDLFLTSYLLTDLMGGLKVTALIPRSQR